MIDFIKEFFTFLKDRKKYWLFPIILILAFFGFLIVLSQGTVVAPFIYTIFWSIIETRLVNFLNKKFNVLDGIVITKINDKIVNHFYIDSQVWKFSIKHNRENVLFYLKKVLD